AHEKVAEEGMGDRCWISQAGGFDQNPVETRYLFPETFGIEITQRAHEIAADRAADAPRVEHHRVLIQPPNQQMVETDLPELVDENSRVAQRRMLEQAVEDRRLAASE